MTQPEDLDDLKTRVTQMQTANDTALADLARHHGVQIDQASAIGLRLGELTEHLLGDNEDPRRLAYEERVQRRYTQVIADANSQIARAKLLEGVNGAAVPNGLPPR